jgi:hypothetical protein
MKIDDLFFRRILQILVKFCPYNKWGDFVIHYFWFFYIHKRIPGSKNYINDFLYQIKVTDEIIDPLRIYCSDKENVKKYIKKKIGNIYNVPTIAILRTKKEIDNFFFKKKSCVKPTHSSGQVLFVRRNSQNIKKKLKEWLKLNFYWQHRERNYKNLEKKIIIEPIIFNNTNLNDYKFFVYKGKVKFIQVDFDRKISHKRKTYDTNWKDLNFSAGYPHININCKKPKKLKKMIDLAEKLGEDFNFIRVDMYTNGTKIYVGELTSCPTTAHAIYYPKKSEEYASNLFFN